MTNPPLAEELSLTPITGGFHIKTLPDGRCIDVLQMMFNWRVVIGRSGPDHGGCYDHGWCYFGHSGKSMEQAFVTAVFAAQAWDGNGSPSGFDKQAV